MSIVLMLIFLFESFLLCLHKTGKFLTVFMIKKTVLCTFMRIQSNGSTVNLLFQAEWSMVRLALVSITRRTSFVLVLSI